MILVTGASGFVGGALVKRLAAENTLGKIVAVVRRPGIIFANEVKSINLGNFLPTTNWGKALEGVSVLVHCAARVHVMNQSSTDSLAEFRYVNTNATSNLARQAAVAGVRRFIFLSSIKVNGEYTKEGQFFDAESLPNPASPYSISKLEAEQSLRQIAFETGMEVVIIRSPLVYGPGVSANFESMMRCLVKGIPLPLKAITENRRSLVALDNLIDLIMTCLNHHNAANETFLASDGEDLSTNELLKRTGLALGKPASLFYVPIALLKFGTVVTSQTEIYHRLCSSLKVDIEKTRHLLGWNPPITVQEGLRQTVEGFLLETIG